MARVPLSAACCTVFYVAFAHGASGLVSSGGCVGERVVVFVLCNVGEPPSTARLVVSSFTGVSLVLWGVVDTCGICSDAP